MKAPESYYKLPASDKKRICNGCGPEGWVGFLIPDKMLSGVDLTECCNIHDYMYYVGGTEDDRLEADQYLHDNIINAYDKQAECPIIQSFGYIVADIYKTFVNDYGHKFFTYEKHKNDKDFKQCILEVVSEISNR